MVCFVSVSLSLYNNTRARAWIFILEGLATVLAGIVSFFIIQDFPDTARFLSEPERAFVIRRLQADDQFSAAGEKLRWKYIFQSILDWKTWVGSACLMSLFYFCSILGYGLHKVK